VEAASSPGAHVLSTMFSRADTVLPPARLPVKLSAAVNIEPQRGNSHEQQRDQSRTVVVANLPQRLAGLIPLWCTIMYGR